MKSLSKPYLLILIFFFLAQSAFAQYEITGRLANYDSLWNNKLYLALVKPNEPFWSISKDQIINSTTVDSTGKFILKGYILPESDCIVRLYLTRNGTEVLFSTHPRNYLLLIINLQSKIYIEANNFSSTPLDYSISGDLADPNAEIKQLELLRLNFYKQHQNMPHESETAKKLLQDTWSNSIKRFCSSSKYPLVKLLALHNLDLEEDYEKDQVFYYGLLQELKQNDDQNSIPYIQAFEEKITKLQLVQNNSSQKINNSSGKLWFMIALAVIIFLIAYIIYLRKNASSGKADNFIPNGNNPSGLIRQLTQREKEILSLIVKEYQNKEIAAALHLEISTIKTHLSSIYRKLNIKNRKEAKQFSFIFLEKD